MPVPILEMRGISKRFPGVQALDRVDFTLYPGEVHALMGENGAGKSTLMNILNGLIPADGGEIRVQGRKVDLRNNRDAEQQGIAIIHQELNLVPALSVAENLFLGRYPLRASRRLAPWRRIDWPEMRRQAVAALERVDLRVDPATPVEELGIAQQQLVEIARALLQNARIVAMDEPTSALTAREIAVLYKIIRELRASGHAIVFISHKLDEIEELADRVTVLRNGRWVGSLVREEMDRDTIVKMMIGRELEESIVALGSAAPEPARAVGAPAAPAGSGAAPASPATAAPGRPSPPAVRAGEPLLAVEGLTDGVHFRDVSFQLAPGEILGVAGLVGSGRSELLEALNGARPVSGTIRVSGRPVRLRSPEDALNAGIAYLPEDRRGKGLFIRMDVGRNLTAAQLRRFVRAGLISTDRERAEAQGLVGNFDIRTAGLHQTVRTLSGGNQQKVVLARCVDTGARIILLNEPTRGVDVGAKGEIYRLMDRLRAEGRGMVVVSSELPELLRVSDRILVIARGRITATFQRHEATQDRLLRAMFGETAPPMAQEASREASVG